MMTRLLMALFVVMTLGGAAVLISGCDDDTTAPPTMDLSAPDLRSTNHD
jgi:hypothetical protein